MSKTLIYSQNATGVGAIAPSAAPGPLTAYGIYDLVGNLAGVDSNHHFYANGNSDDTGQGIQFSHAQFGGGGGALPNMNGGEIQIDFNVPPGNPIGFSGDITLWLNAVSGTAKSAGLAMWFAPRLANGGPGIFSMGVEGNGFGGPSKSIAHTYATYTNLRMVFRARPAGTGPSGNSFIHLHGEVQDISAGFAIIETQDIVVDSRTPWANGTMPAAGVAAVSGFYTAFGQVNIWTFDTSGILTVVDQPFSDWQSKTTIRIIGQVPMGGSTPSYQWQYRVQGSGTWLNVPVSGQMTGTSPSTVVNNLTPATSYEFQRLTNDGTTFLTSATVTRSTLAAGSASYACIYRGDSITIGQTSAIQNYDRGTMQGIALTAASVQLPSATLNLGQGGISSGQVAAFRGTDVQLAAELQPDAIDVMIGTNDAAAFATGASYQANLALYSAALNAANVRVVYHGPPFQNSTPGPSTDASNALISVDYISAINNLAAIYPNTYRGDTAFYGHSQTNASTYFADALHPNSVGDTAMGVDQTARLRVLFPTWYPVPASPRAMGSGGALGAIHAGISSGGRL